MYLNCAFIFTEAQHKILVGEPDTPLPALPRGKGVLVDAGEYFQVADYSLVSIMPTVILLNDIPEEIDGSWYKGKPLVGLKITAIDPSTAIRNAQEITNALTTFYGSKKNVSPVLVIYTDGEPERRSTCLSLKIAVAALQK